jgi:hypothetical protein
MGRLIVASFAREADVLAATTWARERGLCILDVYAPYAVHGLEEAMGLRRSRLSWVCFGCGFLGVAVAFMFQFWTMTVNWPLNVGGKPWNSLPAFVPVAFEVMVLLAGLGVVLAFCLRCRLFPGKGAGPFREATDNTFVLVVESVDGDLSSGEAASFLDELHALQVEERND